MKKFMDWLETSFTPKMHKFSNNIWISSIKDSMMQVLPFIFLGSLFAMITIITDNFPDIPSFWIP